jgi:hypothetical protein
MLHREKKDKWTVYGGNGDGAGEGDNSDEEVMSVGSYYILILQIK